MLSLEFSGFEILSREDNGCFQVFLEFINFSKLEFVHTTFGEGQDLLDSFDTVLSMRGGEDEGGSERG